MDKNLDRGRPFNWGHVPWLQADTFLLIEYPYFLLLQQFYILYESPMCKVNCIGGSIIKERCQSPILGSLFYRDRK
jgi:hypothetical protein